MSEQSEQVPQNPERVHMGDLTDLLHFFEREIPEISACFCNIDYDDTCWEEVLSFEATPDEVDRLLARIRYEMRQAIKVEEFLSEHSPKNVLAMMIAGGHAILKKAEMILREKTDIDMTNIVVDEPLTYTISPDGKEIFGEI